MPTQEVVFHWSTEKGACIECGNPAAYEAPDAYGVGGNKEGKGALLCSVCAAMASAVDGEPIIYLFDS